VCGGKRHKTRAVMLHVLSIQAQYFVREVISRPYGNR
jgi:hypothetical protein